VQGASEAGKRGQATDSKLRVGGVHKRYGAAVALAPTSLELRAGEFLTLLGPSGSGKTTLLMIVAGLLRPDGGEIWIDGVDATRAPAYKRDIGMVFQNYALFPHLTVFENIAFPLRTRRLGEAEIRKEVARVLETVQLPHVAGRMPRQLSGGQQQRIALARCIVYRPSIILMDEPLGALDKKLRDQLQLEIKHLHHQLGTTVLYVTHDQQETLTMSDRICLMNNGRIEQIGTPEELYFRPRTIFAADFLGESNLFDGEIVGRDGSLLRLRAALAGDAELRAPLDAAPEAASGRVKLMVRPESLRFAVGGEPGLNTVRAVVREVIFIGAVSKYFVATESGATLSMTLLTAEQARVAQVGDEVTVGWPQARTVVLPVSG
jgi:putative spermidine/putrescine transport system ATP-binding protein